MYAHLYEQARKINRRHRHVTAIVYKHHYTIGQNSLNTGRCGKHSNFSVHSEVQFISNYLKETLKSKNGKKVRIDINNAYCYYKLPKIILINVRVLKNGSIAESKPCEDCMSLIKKYNVKELHYFNGKEIVIKKF